MDLRHFQTFVKVVEKQSFSKAAEALGYTQAAVTVQIQQLEEELRTPLFDRMKRQIYLTEAGEKFIYYANEVLRTVDEAATFNQRDPALSGAIRVGTVGSIGTAWFPKLICEFHRDHPDVEIKVVIGKTDELIEMMNRNEIDLVFTIDEKIYMKEIVKPIQIKQKMIFVTHPHHLDLKRKYRIRELAEHPFLLTEKGEAYRYELERFLAKEDVQLKTLLEVGDIDIITSILERGLGIAFIPEFSVVDRLKSGQLNKINVTMPHVEMWAQVMYHEKKYLTGTMYAFIECIRTTLFSDEI